MERNKNIISSYSLYIIFFTSPRIMQNEIALEKDSRRVSSDVQRQSI